jgi:hypothetical protein
LFVSITTNDLINHLLDLHRDWTLWPLVQLLSRSNVAIDCINGRFQSNDSHHDRLNWLSIHTYFVAAEQIACLSEHHCDQNYFFASIIVNHADAIIIAIGSSHSLQCHLVADVWIMSQWLAMWMVWVLLCNEHSNSRGWLRTTQGYMVNGGAEWRMKDKTEDEWRPPHWGY